MKEIQENKNNKNQNVYTEKEIEIIRKYYPIGDWDSLLTFLPNRKKGSIHNKAWSLGIKQDKFYWNESSVKQTLEAKGFFLNSIFTDIKSKHKLSDIEGYFYHLALADILYRDKIPNKVSTENIYSIENIRHFISLNNIDCNLLSDKYTGNKNKLEWKCRCGDRFLCSWTDFMSGKHQCNKCSSERQVTSEKLLEKYTEYAKKMNYNIINGTFDKNSRKIGAITNEGYKIILNKGNLYANRIPQIFYINNPYVIENINHYLLLNNIKLELLSTEYNGNNECLLWKCKCEKIFERSWNKILAGETKCKECSLEERSLKRRKSIKEINDVINKSNYHLMEDISNIPISTTKFCVYDDDGYLYDANWTDIRQGRELEKFHPNNKYTIQNINQYLEKNRNSEYICLSEKYLRNSNLLKFKHVLCGNVFEATLVEMQGKLMANDKDKYFKQCPKCYTKKMESFHALTLKQVFMHEFPDTTLEDKSCINPRTNRPLPTDIVNHRLKIAIEVQSSCHDTEKRKIIDKYKKEFWINAGYKFFDPDIRDYSILEMIQLFFPTINKIPDYVDYTFSNCINHKLVQKLLYDGDTIREICNKLSIKKHNIHNAIKAKRIILPKGYKNRVFNIKPIVQLDQKGNFINRFESLCDADRNGFKFGTVRRVLHKKQNFAYNCFWIFEEEYLKNNYKLPKLKDS